MSALEERVTHAERRSYRGGTLEELLPRIREELGPEAVIVRRREGVVGGIAGFFGKRCVEVDVEVVTSEEAAPEEAARAARVLPASLAAGAYVHAVPVELEELDGPLAEGVAHEVHTEESEPAASPPSVFEELLSRQIHPFAAIDGSDLSAASVAVTPAPAPRAALPAVEPEALGVLRELSAAGVASDTAASLLCHALSHYRSLACDAPLRSLVRQALAASLSVCPGWVTPRRVVAFVGLPGSDAAGVASAICAGYAGAGLSVGAVALGDVRAVATLAAGTEDVTVRLGVAECLDDVDERLGWREDLELVVAVAPMVTAEDPDSLDRTAAFLERLAPSETHLVVPASSSARAVRVAVTALGGRVRVSGLVPSGRSAGEPVGGVVSVAVEHRLAVSWVAAGSRPPVVLPADAWLLAEQCLPRREDGR